MKPFERIFRLRNPKKERNIDGSGHTTVYHKYGPAAGMTIRDMVNATGAIKEYESELRVLAPIKDHKKRERKRREAWSNIAKKVRGRAKRYATWLGKFYDSANRIPVAMFLPTDPKNRDLDKFYIACLLDSETERPVIGSKDDFTLAYWKSIKQTQPMHEVYVRTINRAKAASKLPGMGKDARFILDSLAHGDVPSAPPGIGYDPDEKKKK